MWKKIGIGIVILLLLIAGAGYYLFANLDSLIKSAIDKYGTEATQTEVDVGSVDLSLTSGSGAISGLTITNPPGYTATNAFYLGSIAVQVDTGSITGTGPVVIDNVSITQPQVTYEVRGLGLRSNLKVIEDNIQTFSDSGQAQAQPQGNSGAARKEIIRNLTITGGEVFVVAPVVNRTLKVPLPAIQLTDLGGNNGATPAQIGIQVLREITRQAATAGAKALASYQLDKLGAGSGLIKNKAGGAFKSLFGG